MTFTAEQASLQGKKSVTPRRYRKRMLDLGKAVERKHHSSAQFNQQPPGLLEKEKRKKPAEE